MANGKAPAYRDNKKCLYPNSSIYIDATHFYVSTRGMTLTEIGQLIQDVFCLATAGRFDELQKYDFIIRTNKGPQKRRYIPINIRRQILSTGKCVFCGDTKRLSVDHIIPITCGGTDSIDNFQCLCLRCNIKKGNKTTYTTGEAL